MNQIKDLLDQRTKSGFDLSIGTGISLETLFLATSSIYDKDRIVPRTPDLNRYKKHLISIDTLIRNIINSTGGQKLILLNSLESIPAIASVLMEEIEIITELYQVPEAKGVYPEVYATDYSVLEKNKGKFLTLRTNNTDNQIRTSELHKGIVKEIGSDYYRMIGYKLPAGRILITTSNAFDLLNYKNRAVFDLLESHTGKIKSILEFNSKYSPMAGNSFSRLPFTEKLLYIFGDKNLIKPMKTSIRKTVLEIAEKDSFTPLTTENKIKHYFSKDLELKEVYRNLPTLF